MSVSAYTEILRQKGKPLADPDQGNDKIALAAQDALHALDLLHQHRVPVSGGDILADYDQKLIYANQILGEEYAHLNWYCEKEENENDDEYLRKSVSVARNGIMNARTLLLEQTGKECYVVLLTM